MKRAIRTSASRFALKELASPAPTQYRVKSLCFQVGHTRLPRLPDVRKELGKLPVFWP